MSQEIKLPTVREASTGLGFRCVADMYASAATTESMAKEDCSSQHLRRSLNHEPSLHPTASGWSEWTPQWSVSEERAARELEFWRELNAYAVRERGRDNTLSEFKLLRADGTNWEEKTS